MDKGVVLRWSDGLVTIGTVAACWVVVVLWVYEGSAGD